MIDEDIITLYTFPPGFEWDIKDQEGFCPIHKYCLIPLNIIYDRIMDSYNINGELKRIWFKIYK